MAVVKAEELRSKSQDELKTQLTSLKKEAFNLRFQGATPAGKSGTDAPCSP
jgi:ribosomal protein L29